MDGENETRINYLVSIQYWLKYLRCLPFDIEDEEKLEAVSIQKPVESNLQKDDKAEEENLEVPDVRHCKRKGLCC